MNHVQNKADAPKRYLAARPAGVRQWLSTCAPTRERSVMLHILVCAGGCELDAKAMATALGCTATELAATLFSLNRLGSLQVVTDKPPQAPAAWLALRQHLTALAQRAGGHAAVFDAYGLCIANAGTDGLLAHQFTIAPNLDNSGTSFSLYPDDVSGHFVLSSVAEVGPDDPAWTSLAECLVRLLGGSRPCSWVDRSPS